jgi:DHA1 family multidrug resistance protein-like MFS transporter
LSAWTAACFWGPAIGPLVAGFAVQANGWRWGLYEIIWFTGPILIVFLFAYPETSTDNILRRRAQRLRKLTGAMNIKSRSEIEQEKLKASEVFWDAIIKPIEIMVKDPAVAFTNIYVSNLPSRASPYLFNNKINVSDVICLILFHIPIPLEIPRYPGIFTLAEINLI